MSRSLATQLSELVNQISTIIVGKRPQIEDCVACLLAGGHLLIEDVPGVGKTTLAHAISVSLGLKFSRTQFTADLMPSDLIGVSVYERTKEAFVFHAGPVFAHVLLADEINRAGPKTQSALLEAMEEHQVTVEGETRALPMPFFVIATQNPTDQLGTYPLPESQLDRFLMCITLGYPDRKSERELLAGGDRREAIARLDNVMSPLELVAAQKAVQSVHASEALLDYLQADHPGDALGRVVRRGPVAARRRGGAARCARAGAARWPRLRRPRRHPVRPAADDRASPDPGRGRGPRPQRAGAGDDRGGAAAVSAAEALPPPFAVRRRVRAWLTSRLPRTDTQLLTQGNIYILPTRAGWLFALTLIVLLLASINYQLNLGYVLTFLLAGSGIVSMHITHGTLRGLTLHLRPVAPAFAGAAAVLDIVITSPGKERYGLGLRLLDAPSATLAWTNIPGGGQAIAHVSFVPTTRGLHDVPTLSAETPLSARPVPRLDGLAAVGAAARLSGARGQRRRRCRPPGRRAMARRCRGAARAARSKACAPTGAAIRSSWSRGRRRRSRSRPAPSW